jgi:uncharacterized membrane protein YjfL (UPF0719 family)
VDAPAGKGRFRLGSVGKRRRIMEQIFYDLKPVVMLSTIIYAVIGFCVFSLFLYLMVRAAPFSIRKEIEEDQNIALAILMGSIFIALAIIVQAAIRG